MKKFLCCVCSAALMFFSVFGLVGCTSQDSGASYTMSLEYVPSENKLYGKTEIGFRNETQNALQELKFQLYPNAYREDAKEPPVSELYASFAYYDGESYGGVEITEVKGGDWRIAGEDCNILCVTLPQPLYPDERTTVSLTFEVTLARINHRLGVGQRTVNFTYFYPVLCPCDENGFCEISYSAIGDPFVSECADYSVSFTFPSEYRVVSGMEGETETKNGHTVFSGSAKNVRDISFVLGKELKSVSAKQDGVAVEYWYLDDEDPQSVLEAATKSLSCFSEKFGAYAYPRYVLVQTDFPYSGMETSSLTLLSAKLQKKEIPALVAHETAHQWWYAAVGSDQSRCAWQDEGLAEYSTALFFEAYPEYENTYEQVVGRSESSYRAYCTIRSQLTGEVDTSMNRPLSDYSGEYEYRNLAYDKGVILFDRVRSVLGDNRFFAALKQYYSAYSGKLASWEQLVQCFSASGLDIEGIFLSFIDGTCVI